MSRLRNLLATLPALLFLAPAVAWPEAGSEDLEQNRRDLAHWHEQPGAYERLRRAAAEFLELPPEKQLRLVQLDRDLHRQGSAAQARLLDTLARYADWHEALPEADRQFIDSAPGRDERLRRIRQLREKQWLATLPGKERAEVAKLQGRPRAERIARLREEERQRRHDWQVAGNSPLWEAGLKGRLLPHRPTPGRLSDLDATDLPFVLEYLKPRLSPGEWERLEQAQGRWPRFARVLVELADKHPPALPGTRGPTRLGELPAELQKRLERWKGGPRPRLVKAEGQWPGFAAVVRRMVQEQGVTLRYELWPAAPADLSEGVREFLRARLLPVLDPREKEQLRKAEGSWPGYPRAIQELAARHYLRVPWLTLPGNHSRWEGYRLRRPPQVPGLPPVARQTLRDFAQIYLSAEERDALNLSDPDPAGWERLARTYFERRPEELRRLREIDRQPPGPAAAP